MKVCEDKGMLIKGRMIEREKKNSNDIIEFQYVWFMNNLIKSNVIKRQYG